ncbi:MAG TPA: DUF192 domain-containing protein [Candidatus Limnocylindrales bacterium]|nr:DUF192 domain-containing protein [Candidatus Limnocylindrales bacterium]
MVLTPRQRFVLATVAGMVVLGLLWSVLDTTSQQLPKRTISISNISYRVDVVTTSEQQAQGLSGRNGLPSWAGMLFDNDVVAERCMWMKSMRFPIDILWIDAQRRIVKIESKLEPRTYPQAYCAVAADVLELAAGQAEFRGFKVGQLVKL